MKIMFYISTIREGGAARVMTNLANHFSETDNVSLVTNFSAETEYSLNAKVKRYSIEKSENKANFLKKNVSRVTNLIKIVKAEKPDLIVSFMHQNDGRALLAARLTGTKVLMSVRNDPNKLFKTKLKKVIAQTIYGLSDGVVFQTPDAQAWFSKRVQDKSQIIFNPVNPIFYQVERNPQPGLIVTCGRLVQFKRHDLLIDAFAEVHKQKPATELRIYGEGPLRAELQDRIERLGLADCAHLMGATNNVVGVLSTADLFVLSSDYEGMPNALMEAMAAGVPCVATDCPCGGPKELMNGKEDALVPIRQMGALRDKILLAFEWEGKEMKLCAQQFMPERVFEQWNDYMKKIVC